MLGDEVQARRRFAPSLTVKDGRRWVPKSEEESGHDA